MFSNILDNLPEVKKIDSQNMLGSLALLGKQIEQIAAQAAALKVPASYKKVHNIVVLGMGGSTLGSHVIKAVFHKELPVPLDIINGYHLPASVNKKTLVIVSSYSGTTEEPLFALREAMRAQAKLIIITSGGTLSEMAVKSKIPALIFSTENNPCGSPRMGLGYSIVGQIILLAKAGLVKVSAEKIKELVATIAKYQAIFGIHTNAENNSAKKIAIQTREKSVWYCGAEHLAGNVHVAANQMNENAKRFAGYFLIPELNHHLMEGVANPKSNQDTLLFVLIESNYYDKRVQKRFEITKNILAKSGLSFMAYQCQEKDQFLQMAEVLILSSYISYYSALLHRIDPTAIPWVDYFKEQLKR